MSGEPENSGIVGWSPDSRWIIYSTTLLYDEFGTFTKSVNAVQTDGSSNVVLYEYPNGMDAIGGLFREIILGWISPTTFVVHTYMFEGEARNIRQVDIVTRKTKIRFDGIFAGADLDEKTGTLYVYEYPMYGGLPDPSNGFYRLDFETGKYEMIIPQPENSDIFSGWSTRLNAVVVEYFNYPDVMSTVVLDSLGKKLFEFAGSMSVSPNCQLILVAGDDGSALFDGGGQFVRDISNETYRGVIWSFDSNGFYRLESTSTYLHTMENNWIGETILGPCADFELFHP